MRILALVAEIPGIVFMYGLGKRAWAGVWRINNKTGIAYHGKAAVPPTPFVIWGQKHAPYKHGVPRILKQSISKSLILETQESYFFSLNETCTESDRRGEDRV